MTRPRTATLTLAVLAALAAAQPALALEIPSRPEGRLSDYASVLDAASREALEERLARFERETTTQIAVAIFPSLEDEDLQDFTNRLFEHWRLGQEGKNNGVLLAIFMKERRTRIEVGYGLEGALTDALSARILRDRLSPAFREGRYREGIEQSIEGIEQATRGEYAPAGGARGGRDGDGLGPWLPVLFIIAILVVFGVRAFMAALFGAQVLTSTGARRYGRSRGGWGGPFGSGGGWGGWSGGGSGGGGFSGGGGMSGGGGASGGW